MFAALAAMVAAMVVWRDSWWLLLLAPGFGVIATQVGFLGHDVGHLQVTRNPTRMRLLGLVDGNLMGGMSFGWWVAKHNAHHAHPNDLETDPDVRAGVLVFDADQADHRSGLAAWTTRHQAFLFFPFLLGEAVNLHIASARELFTSGLRQRVTEGALMLTHYVLYVGLLVVTMTWPQALLFVAIHKGVQGLYLGCSFAPNHKGMPVLDAEQAADPLLRQVLTSRNVRGGPFTDAALGGLNYQIEHHLFPSMPRANLRLGPARRTHVLCGAGHPLPRVLGLRVVRRGRPAPARSGHRPARRLTRAGVGRPRQAPSCARRARRPCGSRPVTRRTSSVTAATSPTLIAVYVETHASYCQSGASQRRRDS